MPATDPHRKLLNDMKALEACAVPRAASGSMPGLDIGVLAERIISEPARTVDGVLAKIAYLERLAWSDPTRRLAMGIRRDIEKLWPL